jgi:GNAT superfamily N-acetyltransferase
VSEIEVRRAADVDLPEILHLLEVSLGWHVDATFAAFFDWKHRQSAFGPSPAWVAVDADRIVGLRILMRWEFDGDRGVERAVRAVDTATHPDAQGKGIFTRLTRIALEELEREGVAFVFNTPNDQSRPGYLKMGWDLVGRLPVGARPRSVGGLVRMARARVPAGRWSEPSTAGEPAADVLADREAVAALTGSQPPSGTLRTRLSPEFLAWRYGTELLPYRAVVGPGGIADGVGLFRVRQRGSAREGALCEVLAPGGDAGLERALVRRVARVLDADYLLGLGRTRRGLAPLPRQGPILTWRRVATERQGPPAAWSLGLGDIELF